MTQFGSENPPSNNPQQKTNSESPKLDSASFDQTQKIGTGAENIRFDLSKFYKDLNDPQLMLDVQQIERMAADFDAKYRDRLAENLETALDDLTELNKLQNKVGIYIELVNACDETDQSIRKLASKVRERLSKSLANHLAFFDIELGHIDQAALEKATAASPKVAFLAPFIEEIRKEVPHQLSEPVERALAMRGPFGPSTWSSFLNQELANFKMKLRLNPAWGSDTPERELTIETATTELSENHNPKVRAAIMRTLNRELERKISPIAAEALNAIIGKKIVEDQERNYPTAMSARNMSNSVSEEVVDALHESVRSKGSELAKRYYKLLAKNMGQDTLAWSDRNAPTSEITTRVTWDEAVETVRQAYRSFSPTMEKLFNDMIEQKRVDAPSYPGKGTGAFNISASFPEPIGVTSFNFLNFMGTAGDVTTLAHEAGHGAHGELAGRAQGPLMSGTPIAYAETASIFAEMVTFNFLLQKASSPEERLAMLLGKIQDFMNTVVRQISFSDFEQRIHEARKDGKLKSEDFVRHWREATETFYGKDGDVFRYKDIDHLWSYVHHFHRPFYVYGYAFGELLTQSLYAVKDEFGEKFEPLYLDLLRAGGTKDAVSLLEPFGLNPEDPEFWNKGMASSVEKWIEEAERLSALLKHNSDNLEA